MCHTAAGSVSHRFSLPADRPRPLLHRYQPSSVPSPCVTAKPSKQTAAADPTIHLFVQNPKIIVARLAAIVSGNSSAMIAYHAPATISTYCQLVLEHLASHIRGAPFQHNRVSATNVPHDYRTTTAHTQCTLCSAACAARRALHVRYHPKIAHTLL